MDLLPHVCFLSAIVFTPFVRVGREQHYAGAILFCLGIFFQPCATLTEERKLAHDVRSMMARISSAPAISSRVDSSFASFARSCPRLCEVTHAARSRWFVE